jgi:lipopolysaccharide export system protein LptA
MKKPFSTLIATGCLTAFGFALVSNAQAERADREKPTVIDSDTLNHDEQRQVTVFTGNVVLTKGTLNLRGDRMELWQDEAGNYYGLVNGKPARFRQKREGVNEFIEGESLTLDYDGKTETVVLIGNAIMRRLEGDVLKDQVSGDRLTYNNVTERYRVESGAEQGRSRMFLMPSKEGSTPLGSAGK